MKTQINKLTSGNPLKKISKVSLITIFSIALIVLWSAPLFGKVIKVGAILAITGPASFLGDPEHKTLKMYIDNINKAGGVNGDTYKLISYDTGANPKKATTFAKRLLTRDKVNVIIGPSTTGETMAIINLVKRYKVPMISLAGAVVITDPVKKYVFKTPATDRMACDKIYEYMKKKKISKIALISGTGGFGQSMRKQCTNLAKKYKIKILADETYGARDNDMSAQLTKIKNTKGIQAVINPGFGGGPVVVTKNYKQLGIKLPLFQSHGVASKKYIELSGNASEGVFITAGPLLVADQLKDNHILKKGLIDYKKKYTRTYNSDVSTFGGYAYGAMMLLTEAITISKSSKPAAIQKGLEKIKNFSAIDGIVNFSKKDHLGLNKKSSFIMLQIKNKNWKIVD